MAAASRVGDPLLCLFMETHGLFVGKFCDEALGRFTLRRERICSDGDSAQHMTGGMTDHRVTSEPFLYRGIDYSSIVCIERFQSLGIGRFARRRNASSLVMGTFSVDNSRKEQNLSKI